MAFGSVPGDQYLGHLRERGTIVSFFFFSFFLSVLFPCSAKTGRKKGNKNTILAWNDKDRLT